MNRILHILTGTERGGCEVNALNLIQASPQLSHHLIVLGPPGPMSPEFEDAGTEVRHADGAEALFRSHLRILEESIADSSPSGIIIWHGMVGLPGILHTLRDYNGRVLVHGGNPAHSMSPLVDWRYYLTEKLLGRRCEATYVCCSQFVADSFQTSRYLQRFRKVVVPNGVQPRKFSTDVTTKPESDTFVLGMTARLDRIKDHSTLLKAFALVVSDIPNTRLEIAGDGELRHIIEELAVKLGVSEKIRFLGMVPDVSAVLQTWDLFVYATTDREGFGNALIEAMMSGLPCIATNTGPIPEITGHFSVSNLVPAGDPVSLAKKIVTLMRDNDARTILASEGRKHAEENFTHERFANAYLNALHLNTKAKQ